MTRAKAVFPRKPGRPLPMGPGATVVLVLGLMPGSAEAVAGLQGPGEEATRIDLGFDMGEPGLEVALPIQLEAPEGVRVGATTSRVTFPAGILELVEVRPDPSLEAEVSSSPGEEGADQEVRTVEVTVTATPGQALSNGVLAFLVFKVSEDVQDGRLVRLHNLATALSAEVPGKPIQPVTNRDGEIEVLGSTPAIIACFFYLH